MARHEHYKVRKAAPRTYLIQEQTDTGYKTVGKSRTRVKANMSAGIRDSNWGKDGR